MVLDKYIKDLLFREECVIVPGLGGFITNYASAEIRGETQSFIPPSKRVGFNAELIDDDGLLTAYISEEMDRPEDVVHEMIENQVTEIRALLSRGETIILEGVGNLMPGSGGTIVFTGNLGTNFLLESFGLSSFTFPELEIERERFFGLATIFRNRNKLIFNSLPGSINQDTGKDRTTSQLIIALSILLLISILPFNSRISESIFKHPATLGPLPSLRYLEVPQAQEITNENMVVYQFNNEGLAEEVIVQETNISIIAGSFQSLVNAEDLSQKLISRGFKATLRQDNRSFYRVVISEFTTLDAAESALPNLQKLNQDLNLWILE